MRGGAIVGALAVTSSDYGNLIREQCINDEVLIRD